MPATNYSKYNRIKRGREGSERLGKTTDVLICRAITPLTFKEDNNGHDNPSDHRHHSVDSRRWLVRPRALVLVAEFRQLKLGAAEMVKSGGPPYARKTRAP